MEKWGKYIEIFCTKFIYMISMGMFGCLTFWAAKYFQEFPKDYSQERVEGVYDSFARNLLMFVLVVLFLYILQKFLIKGESKAQRKRVCLFVLLDLLAVGIFAFYWVTGSHIMPIADQMQVYLTANEFRAGNFSDMKAYFFMCPQQYGLAFLYECILWIWESYHLIQYINILFLILVYYFGYKISEVLFCDVRAGLYTVLIMNGFLPLLIYVNFVYGEMCTIAMCLGAVWSVLKWMESGRKRHVVAASVFMIVALLVRKNMIIVSIALAIILVVPIVRNKRWKSCIVALLLFVLPLGSIQAVEWSYEARSGNEIGKGIPNSLVVAMGMQQSWHGAGVYNAYNHMTFWGEAGGDSEKAAEIARDYIENKVREFAADLPGTRYFYQSKIWEQWNVGSLGSLFMTNHFEDSPNALVQAVYGGELQQKVLSWMNLYLFVVYALVFTYSVRGLFREKEIRGTILPLIAVGGMIFSLLWESKSRYVFPYVTMILPCAAAGVYRYHIWMDLGCKVLKEKMGWKSLVKGTDEVER